MQQVEQAWAGIDASERHHHVVFIDGEGRPLLSRRVYSPWLLIIFPRQEE